MGRDLRGYEALVNTSSCWDTHFPEGSLLLPDCSRGIYLGSLVDSQLLGGIAFLSFLGSSCFPGGSSWEVRSRLPLSWDPQTSRLVFTFPAQGELFLCWSLHFMTEIS